MKGKILPLLVGKQSCLSLNSNQFMKMSSLVNSTSILWQLSKILHFIFRYQYSVNLAKVLQKLIPKTSCGPDAIPAKIYKRLSLAIADPLSTVIRVSYLTGTIPADWSMAHIIPIPKTNITSDPAGYRPVSLTCAASKIMETVVKNCILEKGFENNTFTTSQF